jgi:hypothetical protein
MRALSMAMMSSPRAASAARSERGAVLDARHSRAVGALIFAGEMVRECGGERAFPSSPSVAFLDRAKAT